MTTSCIIQPRPFAIAIDDLGWMNGHNEGAFGYGPYRLGLRRKMTLADYEAVVNLAKRAGVRLQGLFILCELDRSNLLKHYPTTTHMGVHWDNSANISELQIEMMSYVQQEAAFLEFGLHGIGHELWPENGKQQRAEWYNTEKDQPWPIQEVKTHLNCFSEIMKQYGLTKDRGHSFPQSFVPCAYSYYWHPEHEDSLGAILSEYGIKYANTDFSQIPECNPPVKPNDGGFDNGVHVMNRYNYGNLWYQLSALPGIPLGSQPTDYIETHWPNLLAQDDFLQPSVTDQWVAYYQAVQRTPDRFCAKNTSQMHSQWMYNKYTQLNECSDGVIEIDNTAMPAVHYQHQVVNNLVLKLPLEPGQHVCHATLNGKQIPAYFEDQGYALLYLPMLGQEKSILEYRLGDTLMKDVIWYDGTYSFIETSFSDKGIVLSLTVYGTQSIKLITNYQPEQVTSSSKDIHIVAWKCRGDHLIIEVAAHDIQGNQTQITLR